MAKKLKMRCVECFCGLVIGEDSSKACGNARCKRWGLVTKVIYDNVTCKCGCKNRERQ